MPETDFFSISDTDTENIRPDEFYRGLSYLGKPTSITLPGQEPSPAGALAAGAAPVSAPSAGGVPGMGGASGIAGAGATAGEGGVGGIAPGLQNFITAAGFGQKVGNVLDKVLGGPSDLGPAGTVSGDPLGTGALTNTAPDILTGAQGANAGFSSAGTATGDVLGTGALTNTAPDVLTSGEGGLASAAGTAGDVAGSLGGAAGAALPYAGALVQTVLGALGSQPVGEQAINDALSIAGAALAPETYGISALVAGAIELLVGKLFGQQGDYVPKRIESLNTAESDLSSLAQGFQGAAASGDPAQALSALQSQSGDVSSTPGRNPVRTDLSLPPDVAAQLGFQGPAGPNGSVQVQWSQFTPDQFSKFLTDYAANPETFGGYVQGSGDVAYLPQVQAEQAAQNAQDLTTQFLSFLTASQPGAPAAPPAAAPTAAEAAAPAIEPTPDQSVVQSTGQVFPFEGA